jgi:hypothetical protein
MVRPGAILKTGALAGLLDATGATVQYLANGGATPLRIWNYVGSGAFGAASLTGGTPYVIAGLALHFAIAMTWTALLYVAASRVSVLRRNAMPIGVAYGLFVWTIMNRVIVPLSRVARPKTFNLTSAVVGALIIVVCIGIPIVWRAQRDLRA